MKPWGPVEQALTIYLPEMHVQDPAYQPLRQGNNGQGDPMLENNYDPRVAAYVDCNYVGNNTDVNMLDGDGDAGGSSGVKNCPVCTYENPQYAMSCEMCTTDF